MWSDSPWLRSTSTHILAKVKIPWLTLSPSIFRNFPKEFPMAVKTLWCQKLRGRLCNLTRTGTVDTFIVFTSNSGNQGVVKRPALPQNQGPWLIILSRYCSMLKLTMKKPFEHRWISQSSDHVERIQWCRALDFGQNPLNLQITTCVARSVCRLVTSGKVTWIVGDSNFCSTI